MGKTALTTGEREKRGGDRKSGSPSSASTVKLADLGITRDESSRWQRAAAIPDEIADSVVLMVDRESRDSPDFLGSTSLPADPAAREHVSAEPVARQQRRQDLLDFTLSAERIKVVGLDFD